MCDGVVAWAVMRSDERWARLLTTSHHHPEQQSLRRATDAYLPAFAAHCHTPPSPSTRHPHAMVLLLTPLRQLAAALSAAGRGAGPSPAAAAAAAAAGFATQPAFHHHRPRRAMLYVPGDSEKKLRKAASEVAADAVVMDCEDGVALSRKAAARETIARALDELHFGSSEAAVRINAAGSTWAAEDLAAVLGARRLPDALVVPKVEGPDHVRWLFDRVAALLAARPAAQPQQQQEGDSSDSSSSSGQQPMALITMCESAAALLDLRSTFEVARGAAGLPAPPLQLQACILGGDDMAASLGATRRPDNAELAHVRGQFLLVCRALAVQAIDIVKIDLSDEGMRALAAEAKAAAHEGYSGQQVIHPMQVPIVQAAFSPTPDELGAALRLLEAYQQHQQAGQGAFIHQGKMIDAPTMLQARNVLALAERLEAPRIS